MIKRSLAYVVTAVFVLLITVFFAILFAVALSKNTHATEGLVLEIKNTDSGRVYSRLPFKTGDEFAIEFVHSAHNSPVRETFKVKDGKIAPAAVRFYSFGAGMQAELEEGQRMIRDGDALIITGFNRAYAELNYIVGTVSDHLLFINGECISLRNLCGRNAHITLRVKRGK